MGLTALSLAIGLAAAGAPHLVVGVAAREPWEQVLAQQLGLEQKCMMTATYNVQRFALGQETVLSGRARCHDGREFEFSQQKSHLKFDLRMCEPTVC